MVGFLFYLSLVNVVKSGVGVRGGVGFWVYTKMCVKCEGGFLRGFYKNNQIR